jgi:hypothetical protein
MIRITAVVGYFAVLSAACGARGAIHVAPDESKPHLTWEIRQGGEFGDARFVCGSSRATAACTLPPSTRERPARVTLHLYLHPAGRQTNYAGTWRAPFLQGWTASDFRDVSGSVNPGADPYHVSVSGLVTAKPGEYSFSVALDGAQEQVPEGTRITLEIPVTVMP